MDLMIIILQFLAVMSILVYGVNIGLATGLADLSKRVILFICLLYGGSVYYINYLGSTYTDIILEFVSSNNNLFYVSLGLLLIVAGIVTIREWRLHDKNTLLSIILSLSVPYLCFMLSLLLLNSYLTSTIDLTNYTIKILSSLVLIAIILITYFASKRSKSAKKSYQVIMGNYMISLGLYYLISIMVTPNIVTMRTEKLAAVSIEYPEMMVLLIISVIIMILYGIKNNKNNILK